MRVALKGRRLVPANQARRGFLYRCPFCRRKLILKSDSAGRLYYAHLHRSFDEPGETSEHLKGKAQIYEFLAPFVNQLKVEQYLPKINQWPDLITNHTAIEFQCSPISIRRLGERIRGYSKLGIKSWWILGQPYQRKLGYDYLTRFMNYSRHLGFYLLFWRVSSRSLEVRYQLREINDHLTYRSVYVKTWPQLVRFFNHVTLDRRYRQPNVRAGMRTIQRRLFYGDRELVPLQLRLTVKDLSIDNCPLVCHFPAANYPLFRNRSIEWHVVIIMLLDHLTNLNRIFWQSVKILRLRPRYSQMGAVTCFYRWAFGHFIKLLKLNGNLRTRYGHVTEWRPPTWFASGFDKVRQVYQIRKYSNLTF